MGEPLQLGDPRGDLVGVTGLVVRMLEELGRRTTYGMWEETLGFYALLVPLVLALAYDRMVAVGIIALATGTGTLASTVNPFATGVARRCVRERSPPP